MARKSPTNRNSKFLIFKSSKTFFFQISTNSSYTYVKTYYTCSSTVTFLILNLMYNLYIITKPATLLVFLLNVNSLVTSVLNLVLDLRATTFSFSYLAAIMVYLNSYTLFLFYFLLIYFSWFDFSFFSWMMKRHVTEVTWHNVIRI